jgi:hypothetical protein
MKLTHLVVITGVVFGAWTQVEAQDTGREDRVVARVCRADAEKMCSGKTGEELRQCLKTNQAQLSSECKDAVSKLPNPPKS